MSKPDDIPQDVWDKAGKVVGAPNVYVGRLSHHILHERCARAILAERERVANAVKLLRANRQQLHLQLGEMTQQEMRTLMAGLQLAEAAIRHPQETTNG